MAGIPARAETRYRVVPLGPPPQGFVVGTILVNDAETVCGTVGGTPLVNEPFLWTAESGYELLGGLPFGCSLQAATAFGFNDLGHVVGAGYSTLECHVEGFFWSPETGMVPIGDLPGGIFYSWASGVNNLDQVTGNSWVVGNTRAFLWQAGVGMVNLGVLPGGDPISVGTAINDSTWVTGWSGSARGYEGFLWTREAGMIGLGDLTGNPSAADSEPHDINNLGQIVGHAFSAEGWYEAFLWTRKRA